MSPLEIRQDVFVAAPGAATAAAIASAHGLGTWLCAEARAERRAEGRLTLDWLQGRRVVARWSTYEPPAALAFEGYDDRGNALSAAFRLQAEGEGTRVSLELRAADGPPDLAPLWQDALADLKVYVETGRNARELRRPMLGITPDLLTREKAAELGVPAGRGSLLSGVLPGGGAEKAGLRPGDVLLAIDGRPMVDWNSIGGALEPHRAGDTVDVLLWREGAELSVPVTLGGRERPALPETPEALAEATRRTVAEQLAQLEAALAGASEAEAGQRPSPGEWSIKEVLGHLIAGYRFSADWLGRAVMDDPPVDWPERSDQLWLRVYAAQPLATLRERLESELRDLEALILTTLEGETGAPARHQMAVQIHFEPEHYGEHMAQIRACLAAARGASS